MNESTTTLPVLVLHTASDEDLACRVQDGCEESFDELVSRLQPRLQFVLQRRLRDFADVEDVVQKTLLRAYEKIQLFDPSKKFGPWLFTIAIRLAADHHRKPKLPNTPIGQTAEAVLDREPSPEQQAINREQAGDVWALAERILKPDQWTALWLLHGEGQQVREIATTLGRTAVSVRVLLYRARKKLTPHLAKYAQPVDKETEDEMVPFAPQIVRAES